MFHESPEPFPPSSMRVLASLLASEPSQVYASTHACKHIYIHAVFVLVHRVRLPCRWS